MSRVGKQLINLPSGVEVELTGRFLTIKGPKGELKQEIHPQVEVNLADRVLTVKVKNENDRSQRALWGLFASLIKNMVKGVTEGFSKQLEINGVGFTASASGDKLNLRVGFSHPVEYKISAGIAIKTEGNLITISGIDKQLVGETAAQIRKIKKPEPYKGKGIKYVDEQIIRKAGKAAVSSKGA